MGSNRSKQSSLFIKLLTFIIKPSSFLWYTSEMTSWNLYDQWSIFWHLIASSEHSITLGWVFFSFVAQLQSKWDIIYLALGVETGLGSDFFKTATGATEVAWVIVSVRLLQRKTGTYKINGYIFTGNTWHTNLITEAFNGMARSRGRSFYQAFIYCYLSSGLNYNKWVTTFLFINNNNNNNVKEDEHLALGLDSVLEIFVASGTGDMTWITGFLLRNETENQNTYQLADYLYILLQMS